MNAKAKKKEEPPFKFNIKIVKAHWLINGKKYAECGMVEKYYFDSYFHFIKAEQEIK